MKTIANTPLRTVVLWFCLLLLTGCVTAVDDALPYTRLPEISIASPVRLTASPSHPTSYLSSDSIPAGSKVQVIGADENMAWLLVLHGETLGWMPAFIAGTGIATLTPAVVFEPLDGECTQYLGATFDADETWTSTSRGDLYVLGSIYRPETGATFEEASLSIQLSGGGAVVDSDYLHVPLTRNSAVVFFGYSIRDAQRGTRISFDVPDEEQESSPFQTGVFANTCTQNSNILPIGQVKTSVHTPTQREEQANLSGPSRQNPEQTVVIRSVSGTDDLPNNTLIVVGNPWGSDTIFPPETIQTIVCAVYPQERCIPDYPAMIGNLSDSLGRDNWARLEMADPTILYSQGKFHLWFAGRENDNDKYAIGYASSVDGVNWEVYPNRVLEAGGAGSWEERGVAGPDVIVIDGQFVMFYHGFTGNWISAIGQATSDDGIIWSKSRSNPILEPNSRRSWMSHNVRDPSVINVNGEYHMWFAGGDGVGRWIGSASSDDGIHWQIPNSNPAIHLGPNSSWKSYAVLAPDVLLIDETYHMWYTGESRDGNAVLRQIGHATSADGIHWTESYNNPVLGRGATNSFASGGVAHPTIAISNGTYHLWYIGAKSWSSDQQMARTISPDGESWLRYERP